MGFLPWKKIIIFGVELFFGINVVLLDMWVFTQTHKTIPTFANSTQSLPSPTRSETQKTPTPFPTQSPVIQTVTNTSVKEYYIPLGNGQSTTTEYTNVPGAVAYVDSNSYPVNKIVTFEASAYIPAGNQIAWIRLFDATDGHPVWYSEMSWNGGGQQVLVSQPITLDSGNKLYQVQMQTQLGSPAILTQATLHIKLE